MTERKEEDFETYTIRELFEELMKLQLGDEPGGRSSKKNERELAAAHWVFKRKMIRAGVDWS
jgi:hypothetical protein